MTNNLEIAKRIIKKHFGEAHCGLTIDICRGYAYFEVLGLSDYEFKELSRYYESL